VSLDPERTWFRYHQMFADLLQLELRRTAPDQVADLHQVASGWFAGHGYPVEAVRHAQAAQDWCLAARLLADHWPGLYLDGQGAAIHELLAGFPAGAGAADAELAALLAGSELAGGSLEEAEQYLALAERGAASVPAGRNGQLRVLAGVVRLLLARQRGDSQAVRQAARRLQEAAEAVQPGLSQDLRALALVNLGITDFRAARLKEAERHLEAGVALARRTGRPYLELSGQGYQALIETYQSFARVTERCIRLAELAERHGWADEPPAGTAYTALAAVLAWQGRPEEAEPWLRRAGRAVQAEADPAAGLGVSHVRVMVELARGRAAGALAASRVVEPLAAALAAPHRLATSVRIWRVYALVRLGETERAGQALASLGELDPAGGAAGIGAAVLRLACGDAHAAAAALAPVLDQSAPVPLPPWPVAAFVLEAVTRDALGDQAAAGRAVERALDLAGPDGVLLPFLLHPRAGPAHTARRSPALPCRLDRRDPCPAVRYGAGAAARRAARRAAERQRDPRAALPADQPDRAGNRR
jgi:LuxR family maltose regulon positive regulatory protein